MDLSYIISQPWALPVAIGLAGLLIGLLIPRGKGNTNILAALFFWPVSLLRDLLDAAHTKRLQYYALLLALIGMEAFFSVRAATVYYDVLSKRMSAIEVDLVCIIVFVAVFLCGFLVASHGVRKATGKMDWGNFWIAALVVVHDVAGTVWLNYGPGANGSGDWASVSITVGMCCFSLVPFALGNRAEKLRPELEAELDQEVEQFTSAATRTIKRRAVDRVLRLASRTDVIHLVRALPANEFQDFKAFVMPIIAPGISYNLPEMEQVTGILPERAQSFERQESGQIGGQETGNLADLQQAEESSATGQNGNPTPSKMADTKPAKRQSSTGQTGSPATGQNGNTQPASKTATRDEKIRQHAAKYPSLTHAKLAAKFQVSERTIARALNQQNAAPQPPAPASAESSSVNESPSQNGHHSEGERDTDKLEQVHIDESELAGLAHQN